MKVIAAILPAILPFMVLSAGDEKPVAVARLLDEIIHRPGEYAQICDAPAPMPFHAPPIPAYGLSVPQCLFPSDDMKKLLRDRRDEVVKEIATRLEKLDWLHQPSVPSPSEKPLLVKKPQPGSTKSDLTKPREQYPETVPTSEGLWEFDPTKPSGQNPRSLDSIMLSIIMELDAAELLPQLLRLEDDLHKITETALKDDHAPVPVIEIGGFLNWQGAERDYANVENWDKAPPELKRKRQLFDALVFDRELIGVMLELVARKNYAPLKDSTPGRVRALGLRKMVGHKSFLEKIKRPEDIPVDDRDYVLFDRELGIPYWRYAHVPVTYTESLRDESLRLIKCFLDGSKPPVVSGDKLLDEAIAKPGSFSQMCAMPPPVPLDAPIPAYGVLAPRHFSLGAEVTLRLQAYRQEVVPALLERLKNIDFSKPQPKPLARDGNSGTSPRALSSLLLSIVQRVHAIEVLPELLRLEDQLHGAIVKSEKDEKTLLPQLYLDSPVGWSVSKVEESAKKQKPSKPAKDDEKSLERKMDVFACRIYQRELLALIAQLLREEKYQPLLDSSIEKAYIAGLRKTAKEGELKDIKSAEDIPPESLSWIRWDEELGIPVYWNGDFVVKIPYNEALRDDLRRMAGDFLKNVPPAQWKGAAAMEVSLP